MSYLIDVILPLAVPYTFTYHTLPADFDKIQTGCRVIVPFGKSKMYTAIVVNKHNQPPLTYKTKPVYEVVDNEPIITNDQLKLWEFVSSYYMCSLGDVFSNALPASFILKSETIIFLNNDITIDLSTLTDDEFLIYEALQAQPIIKLSEVQKILNKKGVFPIIEEMSSKQIIRLEGDVKTKYKPKYDKFVKVSDALLDNNKLEETLNKLQKSEKQQRLLLTYYQFIALGKKVISVKELLNKAEVSKAVYNSLVKKEILEEFQEEINRVDFSAEETKTFVLSDVQKKALEKIVKQFQTKNIILFKGVTGSGKTEVYIELIKEQLKQNKQVLYLLPEIGLTTQLVDRLIAIFGNEVLVYHSKYSINERHEVYIRMLNKWNESKLIIGTRSSIFLPYKNLGLVIVDEEHEVSFKQNEPSPRYHARDVAIVLAHHFNAKTLLGSATPSLESAYNAYQDKYGTVVLSERYNNVPLPIIKTIDLKEATKKKEMTGHFSHQLIQAITDTLANKKQVIVFQNRRGFSPVLECLECGFVPKCTSCDVSLTYHKKSNHLKCHYCGYTTAVPIHCYECKSKEITTKGIGTEQIEEELNNLFPEASVARMDRDTTRKKHAFEDLIYKFKSKEIDIMVGTQMIAKGFDFDEIEMVGIINSDSALYYPDFRAHERAYQMMVQVAGRAGRKHQGTVYLQTYNPDNNIINQIVTYDYNQLFKQQMYERHQYNYPPFFRVIQIQLKHANYEKLLNGSLWLKAQLEAQLSVIVMGPEEPSINRIKNKFIRNILIKAPISQSIKSTKSMIQKILESFDSIGEYRSIHVIVNVDFY